jgi:tetratricopeptide (TPR) repeat protein
MKMVKSKITSQKLKSVFLLITFYFCSVTYGGNPLVDSAAIYYSKQQYKQSASTYEKVLQAGNTSYALYYNLGNAYYKSEQLGKAIYYYELAKKLNPNDDDVKNNLKIANSKIIDKIESKENFFAGVIKSELYALFSTNGWASVTIVLLALGLGAFLLFFTSDNLLLKRGGFLLGALSIILFFVSFSIGYAAQRDLNKKTQAIVTSQVVQVLNAPTAGGKAKFSLHEGTKLNVLSTNNDWTSVQLANGNEGWIRTQDLGLF